VLPRTVNHQGGAWILSDTTTLQYVPRVLVTDKLGSYHAARRRVLQTCTVAESDRTCLAAVDAAEAFEPTVSDRLARTYAAIRVAAPQAHGVVLGAQLH
jgi:hypothetical protein